MTRFTKEDIAAEMRKVFGEDEKRIGHALRVLSYAEKILEATAPGTDRTRRGDEPGTADMKPTEADRDVVVAAALLHDIGIHEAERKHGSSAGRYQEIEGPPIVEKILRSLGADAELIAEVSDIVGHHHSPRNDETPNFRILYDADTIVNLCDDVPPSQRQSLKEKMERIFLSSAGLDFARRVLLR